MIPNTFQLPAQMVHVQVAFFPLFILSLLAFLAAVVYLWRKGKSVEALLVWNSMFLYIIALILLLV